MDNIYVNFGHSKPVYPTPEAQQTGPSNSRRTVWGFVLCLGLFNVVLLVGLIGLGVTYHRRTSGEERDQFIIRPQNFSGKPRVCPSGWRKYSCSCYLLSSKLDSWEKAREDCRGRGADLVVIESREEQKFLWELARENTWIGLTDRGVEGSWEWIDGNKLVVGFWSKNQPDNGDGQQRFGEEDCVHFEGEAKTEESWNDRRCDLPMHWLCEQLA